MYYKFYVYFQFLIITLWGSGMLDLALTSLWELSIKSLGSLWADWCSVGESDHTTRIGKYYTLGLHPPC